MKKFSSRVLVLLMGSLFAIGSLEVALRAITIFIPTDNSGPSGTSADSSLRVMCLGNSHTYGAGAPKGESYPGQLQRLLEKTKGDNVRVINHGLLNVNSSFIAEALPGWLEEERPNIVFAMVGEPNVWNRYGYWNYLQRTKAKFEPGFLEKLDSLRWLRTFRLVELLWNRSESWNTTDSKRYSSTFRGARKDTEEGKFFIGHLWLGALEMGYLDVNNLSPERRMEVDEVLKVLVAREPKNFLAWRLLAENALHLNRDEQAVSYAVGRCLAADSGFNYPLLKFINLAMRVYPNIMGEALKAHHANLLARISKEKLQEVEKYFDRGFRDFKKNTPERKLEMLRYYPTHQLTLTSLIRMQIDTHQDDILDALIKKIELNPLSPNNVFLDSFLKNSDKLLSVRYRLKAFLENRSLGLGNIDLMELLSRSGLDEQWLISDLEDIIMRSHATGATVVIQTYPPLRHGGNREIDLILRRWWEGRKNKKDLYFQDVGRELEGVISKTGNREQFYSNEFGPHDNHLNSLGYGEVARIMEKLISEIATTRPGVERDGPNKIATGE